MSRRLIVNADDFGRSHSINQAVLRAHREGVLTTASLMVNEPDAPEAIALAKENPELGVGLHLTLLCGRSALPSEKIPGLVNARGEFGDNPVHVGFRYFARRGLREQLRAEIHEQFARFRASGLPLDHVNGHLHLHLHPTVFGLLCEDATQLGIRHLRLTRDDFRLNAKLARGRWLYRLSHAVLHGVLAARSRGAFPRLQSLPLQRSAEHRLGKFLGLEANWPRRCSALQSGSGAHSAQSDRGFLSPARVFGLLQDSHVDEEFILKLLPRLPPGDSELYSHPSLDKFRHEFEALISSRVKSRVEELGIRLIRYQDL